MKIIESTADLSKRDLYELTLSPKIKKMGEAVGLVLQVSAYAIYEDQDTEILSIRGDDSTVYATNSATATREFRRILDLMEGEVFNVEIMKGTSKAGREFITLALA